MNLTNFVLGSLGLWFLLMTLVPVKKPRSTWKDESFSVDDSDFDE